MTTIEDRIKAQMQADGERIRDWNYPGETETQRHNKFMDACARYEFCLKLCEEFGIE